jgi:uncharacterized BrkB/YihY/UPF0761 family membrane protein
MDTARNAYNSSFVTEVRTNSIKYAIGGFSLVAALGWNEAIKATMKKYYPTDEESLKAKYAYALIVTILLVLFIAFVSWRGYNVDQKTITTSTKKGLA